MTVTTIPEVIGQLTTIIAASEAQNSRAGYFAALYKKVTIAVFNKIKEGYFEDNARMEKLDVLFASRYLDAYQQYAQNKACTASWRFAFDACKTWQPMVLHHLLAGMNAHIGLDLGVATAMVSPGAAVVSIHNDFNKINTILGGLVEEVKADLFSMWPLSKLMAKLNAGKIENDIAGFSMDTARDAAWQEALDFAALSSPEAQQNYLASRDQSVADFGNRLLYPGAFIQGVSGVFRVFEFGTISNKIKKLDA